MASNLSNYLAKALNDHVFSATAYSSPGTLYCALFTVAPTDGGGGTEVSGNAYARVGVTNNSTNFPLASLSTGAKSNGTVISFPTATGSWGTVVAVAWFDASSGGNMLMFTTLNSSRAVSTDDTPKYAIGGITITFD